MRSWYNSYRRKWFVGWVLWHTIHCLLFKAKSIFIH